MSLYLTNNQQKIKVQEIATKMKISGHDDSFIAAAVLIAGIYEGAYDLFCLWEEEVDKNEKQKIISDLKNEIEEYKVQVEHK